MQFDIFQIYTVEDSCSLSFFFFNKDGILSKKPEASLIVLYLTFLCTAEITSFFTSLLIICFFFLLSGIPEASLIVPDFTISVFGSSCKYLFFCLIFASFFLLLFNFIPKARWDAKK